jgi:predicted nucleotidyltransferase
VKRERATRLLEEMLGRVAEGGEGYISLIEEISVFGSYARGAPEPGDIDLAVEYGRDEKSGHALVRALAEGRDWTVPYRQALAGHRRGFQFVLGQSDRLRKEGYELVPLWHKGESLSTALERLHAIELIQGAGRAERDAMLPAFEGLDRYLPLPIRKAIVELVETGAIGIERIELGESAVEHPKVRRLLEIRTPNPGIARRVRQVGLSWFERQGIDPLCVAAGDGLLSHEPEKHQLSWTVARLNHLPGWLREHGKHGIWLAVVNPSKRAVLLALKITLGDPRKLPDRPYLLG